MKQGKKEKWSLQLEHTKNNKVGFKHLNYFNDNNVYKRKIQYINERKIIQQIL